MDMDSNNNNSSVGAADSTEGNGTRRSPTAQEVAMMKTDVGRHLQRLNSAPEKNGYRRSRFSLEAGVVVQPLRSTLSRSQSDNTRGDTFAVWRGSEASPTQPSAPLAPGSAGDLDMGALDAAAAVSSAGPHGPAPICPSPQRPSYASVLATSGAFSFKEDDDEMEEAEEEGAGGRLTEPWTAIPDPLPPYSHDGSLGALYASPAAHSPASSMSSVGATSGPSQELPPQQRAVEAVTSDMHASGAAYKSAFYESFPGRAGTPVH